jgi:hypothetical protein
MNSKLLQIEIPTRWHACCHINHGISACWINKRIGHIYQRYLQANSVHTISVNVRIFIFHTARKKVNCTVTNVSRKPSGKNAQLNDTQFQGRTRPQHSGIFCLILTVNSNYFYKNQRILAAEISFVTGKN